jgi:predicted exporter
VSSGVLVGWVLTVALLQQIHIITLVFGVTIIGIAADYAFHYLAHTIIGTDGERTLDIVFTGLATGTATSVLAFIGLTFIPFPGIRQIGVFMAAGLFGSFVTVCLLFPVFYRPRGRGVRLPAFCTRSQITWPASRGTLLILSLVAVSGLLLLEPRADIRDFYAAPVKLQTDKAVIEQALGGAADSRYLLVRAANVEALLQTEEGLRDAVGAGSNPNGVPLLKGISALVPSANRQRENVALLGMLIERGQLQSHLQELGFSDAAQQHILAEFPLELRTLELSSLEGLQLPLGVGGFLGCTNDSCASWLPLPGRESVQSLTGKLDTYPGVTMVDPIGDINRLLAQYRSVIIVVLVVGSGLIILLLTLLWGWRLALRVVMLPVLSCVFTLSVCGYVLGYYTIINLLALLLIVGISLDYAIFRAFTRSEDQPATSLAISLSAMTSVLAFGMLGFSSTPLIASFGQTIAIGLVFAYLLSWCRFGARP